MVYFSCNACGQSVKKNQVEKHYQFQCRSCEVLSCVDCGKDFRGDEYKSHIKCISEEAKYGGKDAKISTNKGEVKQDQWIQNIQAKIVTTKSRPVLSNILEKLLVYSNIPRKKAKFERFIQNSMRLYDQKLISEVWDIVNIVPDNKASPAVSKTTDEKDNHAQDTKEKNCKRKHSTEEREIVYDTSVVGFESTCVKMKKKKHKKCETNDEENGSSERPKVEFENSFDASIQDDDVNVRHKRKHKTKKEVSELEKDLSVASTQEDLVDIHRKKKHKKQKDILALEGLKTERCENGTSTQDDVVDIPKKKKRKESLEAALENRDKTENEGCQNDVLTQDGVDIRQKKKHKKKKHREEDDDVDNCVQENREKCKKEPLEVDGYQQHKKKKKKKDKLKNTE